MRNRIPDKDYMYTGLLGNSYFPTVSQNRDEIPPVFSTEDFTPDIADEMLKKHKPEDRKKGYDQIEYRLSRINNVTRQMHIPHPLPYARLSQGIKKYWERLKHICENPNSLLKPARHDDKRLFRSIYNEVNDNVRDDCRVLAFESQNLSDVITKVDFTRGKFYRVNADISLFFHSIYTHSIPWALVGHSEAKSNQKDGRKWYNQLDRYQQQIKRKETQGVPIGPATSAIMSELILFEIDNVLRDKKYTFFHRGDDYECYCSSEEEGKKFIMHFEQELRKYLLHLNIKKVAFVEAGGKKSEASRLFSVARSTIDRWLAADDPFAIRKTGPKKMRVIDEEALRKHVADFPDLTQKDRASHFGVSEFCIGYGLRKLGITRKKGTRIQGAVRRETTGLPSGTHRENMTLGKR